MAVELIEKLDYWAFLLEKCFGDLSKFKTARKIMHIG